MKARVSDACLVALMAIGSLAMWTAVPAGWLAVVRDLQPAGTRFVVAIVGCLATMAGTGVLLYRLEAVYVARKGTAGDPPPPSWMRTVNDQGAAARRMSLLDLFLVLSAVIAIVALVAWWALLADNPNPSGPLQPL